MLRVGLAIRMWSFGPGDRPGLSGGENISRLDGCLFRSSGLIVGLKVDRLSPPGYGSVTVVYGESAR